MVGAGRTGCGGDVEGGSGGGTRRGVGGDKRGRDGDRLIQLEDNVAHVTLGTDPNSLFAYALVLELFQPIMSTLRGAGGQLERDREIHKIVSIC